MLHLKPFGYGVRGLKLMDGEREVALIYCGDLAGVELLKNLLTAGLAERLNGAPAPQGAAGQQSPPAPAPMPATQP